MSKKGDIVSIWIDCGILALVLLFGFSGYKRGIVYMGINAGGTIVAMLASSFIASGLGQLVYNMICKQSIINGLSDATQGISMSDPIQAAKDTMGAVSNFTQNVFSMMGITQESLATHLKTSPVDIANTVEEMIRPTAIKMVSAILAVVLFLIFSIIVAFLANKFSKDIDRTKLGVPNKVLGMTVGVIEAVFITMMVSLIVYFTMMLVSSTGYESLTNTVDHTVFCKIITKINFPNKIISWLSLM